MEMAGLDKIPASIIEDAEGSRKDAAWSRVEPLLAAQSTQEIIALAPVSLVGGRHLPIEKALAVLNAVYAAHRGNAAVLGPLGTAMDGASDIDLLNAPPPEDPLFSNVVGDLVELLETTRDPDERTWVLKGLLTSARMVLGGAYLCIGDCGTNRNTCCAHYRSQLLVCAFDAAQQSENTACDRRYLRSSSACPDPRLDVPRDTDHSAFRRGLLVRLRGDRDVFFRTASYLFTRPWQHRSGRRVRAGRPRSAAHFRGS
jgi:hypothetical protein